MNRKHMLIEGYCDGKEGDGNLSCRGTLKMGIHCLSCPKFSCSKCPNEMAISNDEGIVEYQEDFIGFGGNMEPANLAEIEKCLAIWREICREKLNEAYKKYIKKIFSDEG